MSIAEAVQVLKDELVCRPCGDQELLEAIKVVLTHLDSEL